MGRRWLAAILVGVVAAALLGAAGLLSRPGPIPKASATAVANAVGTSFASDPVEPAPTIEEAGRFAQEDWGFTAPAGWQVIPHRFVAMSHFTTLGYVSTQPLDVDALCGPTDANGSRCGFGGFGLEPGNAAMMVSSWGFPSVDPVGMFTDPETGRPIQIGGVPAVIEQRVGADGLLHITWQIARPLVLHNWIQIDAEIRGPGADALAAKVATAVESLRFVPAPPVLLAFDGPRIAGMALSRLKAEDAEAFGCFPPPGGVVNATVSALPFNSTLRGHVDATCRTTIAPTPLGLWKLELSMTWAPTEQNPDGGFRMTQWVTPDGELSGSSG